VKSLVRLVSLTVRAHTHHYADGSGSWEELGKGVFVLLVSQGKATDVDVLFLTRLRGWMFRLGLASSGE